MEKKINIAELLKDCLSGMELDCMMYEDVFFDYVDEPNIIHCYIQHETHKTSITFNQHGTPNSDIKSKCVIFPKGKTTWEGFVPPCQFKDGDVIFTHANCLNVGLGNTWISIYKENRNGGVATYIDYAEDGSDFYSDLDGDKAFLCMERDILRQRIATEEEKQKLFDAIKANGYCWNAETKTLEKLVEPKFKAKDRIRHKEKTMWACTIARVKDRYYVDGHPTCFTLPFSEQDDYELVPNKFDINTLVPFESKVLVRDNDLDTWKPSFWGYLRRGEFMYDTVRGVFRQCIPFKGNEYLRGTTDDCNNFYKTWEK